jgi:hypothetical protein
LPWRYKPFIRDQDAERELYLAIPKESFDNLFEEPLGQKVLKEYQLKILVFKVDSEEITQWIPTP